MMQWQGKSPYKILLLISLVIYMITAYFSLGYYHPDEHFQILEFCSYIAGKTPAADLPWEFHAQMRPALQPAIAWGLTRLCSALYITNPFTQALILRMITAFLSWLVISKLSLLLLENFSSALGKKVFLFLSLLLGFVPFMYVRFSSEVYSAIAFLAALYYIMKYRSMLSYRIESRLIPVGLLFGFSFFFRFQIVFAIIGLGLWLLFISKIKWQNVMLLVVSGTIAMAVCVLIDCWFYGKFEFTPYNYFDANIVQHKAANFGIEPWWYFLSDFSLHVLPPFGAVLLLLFFIGLFKKQKDVFVWCLVPFLLVHFIVGHKEMRFLIPITFGFTYLVTIGLEYLVGRLNIQRFGKQLFFVIVILNIPFLLYNMIMPANSTLYFLDLLNKNMPQKAIFISREPNTFLAYGLKNNFYDSPGIKCVELSDDPDFFKYLETNRSDTVFVLERKLSSERAYPGYTNKCFSTIYPSWILKLNVNDWVSRTTIYNLQELVRKK